MIILGIESSCDDTSVALLDSSEKGHFVISEKTASQIDIHKKYGGVVPEIAGRMHAEKIIPLIEEVLKDQPKPEAIAITSGPGLVTGLVVGVEAARTLSFVSKIPMVGVNHIDGHIHSVEITRTDQTRHKLDFPALVLVVSGGHTELVLMKNHGEYEILGKTKDDAAGECFDKVAKLLNLPYPGGPQISKHAENGRTDAISFPRPMLEHDNFDFSFAGLKTSALYWLRDNKLSALPIAPLQQPAGVWGIQPPEITINDYCASIEQAIVDVVVEKTMKAVSKYNPKMVVLAGGVAANKKLRNTLTTRANEHGINVAVPEIKYCMDNAAMIAVAGYYKAKKGQFINWQDLKADPNWRINTN